MSLRYHEPIKPRLPLSEDGLKKFKEKSRKMAEECREMSRKLGILIDKNNKKRLDKILNRRESMACGCGKDIVLKIKKLNEKAVIPEYAHDGDAGFDLSAIVLEKTWKGYTDTVTVVPGEKYIAKTGLAFAVPKGYELQVRPRSGLAYKHGITVINSPGTVDSGYRGEVMVILLNTGLEPFEIKSGDRIAQAVINKLPSVNIVEVEDLDETERGEGGFGSTGK